MLKILNACVWNASSVMLISWVSVLVISRIFEFHSAYISFITQVQSEEWLRQHCDDDHFYHNMAYHTDVCETVRTNSQMSPVLYAMNHSMSTLKMCGLHDCADIAAIVWTGGFPVICCVFMLYICTPSFILPVMRSEFDRRREAAFLQQCSPHVRSHPLDAARANTDTGRIKMV